MRAYHSRRKTGAAYERKHIKLSEDNQYAPIAHGVPCTITKIIIITIQSSFSVPKTIRDLRQQFRITCERT
jgi:hypothetical protein